MPDKNCPRCNAEFLCNVDNIEQCQCYGTRLNDEQRQVVRDHYADCLCRKCLEELKVLKDSQQFYQA